MLMPKKSMRKKVTHSVDEEAQGSDGHLAQSVRERTRELEETNAALRREIAEYQRAEANLRESESNYRAQLENQVRERTAELKQTQEFLQATLDSSLYVVQAFKAVRDESGKIVDFSWVFNNAAGVRQNGEVIGKSLLQRNPGVLETGLFDKFVDVTENGAFYDHEQFYNHEQFNGWFHQTLVKMGDGFVMNTEDITERKRAEEALRQSEEKYRSLFENIDESFGVVELLVDEHEKVFDFIFGEANPNQTRISGLVDVRGKKASEVLPKLEPLWFAAFQKVYDTGEAIRGENYNADTGRWYRYHYSRVGGPGSRFVISVSDDVTARKKAEQEIKESKDLLQTVFDVSLNPIAYHKAVRDASGKIIDFEFQLENREARKYAVEDQTGKRYSEAYPGIQNTAVFKLYCGVVETGENLDTEVQLSLKGIERWFHLMAVKLGDGLVATALDVTERKKEQEEILQLKDEIARRAEDKYRTLFETIDEGFTIVELTRDESGNVVDGVYREVNRSFERQSGMANVVGRRVSELTPHLQPALFEKFQGDADTGVAVREERYIADLDHWFSAHTSRIGGASSNLIASVFVDITERKRREERQAFLFKLSDALRAEPDADAVANRALQMLIEQLQLDRSYITSYYLEQDRAELDYQIGNDSAPPLPHHFILSDYPEAFKTTFEGTLVIEDELERQGLAEAEKRNSGKLGMRAMVAATLRQDENKPVWSMVAISSRPRRWTRDEIALVEQVAERTWAAIEYARAQSALRESERKYRNLFNSMTEGFMICELIYDEHNKPMNWRWLEVNPAFERQVGLASEQTVGKRRTDVFPVMDDVLLEKYARVVRTQQPLEFETYSKSVDRWFYLRAVPLGQHQFAVLFANIDEQKKAEIALQEAHDELEERVIERTQELAEANKERQRLLQQILTAQEEERSHIARELHDELGQQLAALSLKLGLVNEDFDTSRKHRIELDAILNDTMLSMQSLAVGLRPPALDFVGLPETLQNYFEEWVSLDGVRGEFASVGLDGTRLSPDVEIVLYRITQEALTNIRKHAHAGFVNMIVERRGEQVILIIEDDGDGFDIAGAASPSDGRRPLGLLGIRERAALVGGTVEIESSQGKGTTLFVRIPLEGNGKS